MEAVDKLIIFALFLCFGILIYHMHQKIRSCEKKLLDGEIIRQQNDFYKAQYEETKRQRENLKKIRHDMSNKYILELGYLENKQYEELHALYLKEIGSLQNNDFIIQTGNIGIDSVINYKLKMAKDLSVRVSYDVRLGNEVTLENRELNILLGNLFDNALEAVSSLPMEDRVIDFKLRSDRTSLLFEIDNTCNREVKRGKNGEFLTDKKDTENHGIGLKNVQSIVDRYHGDMEIVVREDRFEATVLLYMA